MSLVIASSSQNEFDQTHSTNGGIENPSSFQNFFRSPLKVEANSEIALVSLKCNRLDSHITVKQNEGFYLYWGTENPVNSDPGTSGIIKLFSQRADDVNLPLAIKLTAGTYIVPDFLVMLKTVMEDVVLKAYGEVKSITVAEVLDSTSKELKQFSFKFEQHGNGSALANKPAHTDFEPFVTDETFKSFSSSDKEEEDKYTDNFVASASGTDVLITGYNNKGTRVADAIGKKHPLSLVEGKCVVYFNGSSSATTKDGYTIGLIRKQGYTSSLGISNRNYINPSGMTNNHPILDSDVNLPDTYDAGTGNPQDDIPFWWDVCFNWKNGQDGQVLHMVRNPGSQATDTGQNSLYMMRTVTLAQTPTNASLEGNYFDRVEFETFGEEIKVSLGLTGKTTLFELVDGNSTPFGDRVKPLGITCNQLYPKISIHNNDATTPGTAWLNKYTGHAKDGYYEPNTFGYGYQSPFKPTPIWKKSVLNMDTNSIYKTGTKVDPSVLYSYKETLASEVGLDYDWSLIFTTAGTEYFSTTAGRAGDQRMKFQHSVAKVSSLLGFDAPIVTQTTYGTSSVNGTIIDFRSTVVPDSIITSSMFVRLKNQALNSYNGIKSSVSNIIYSCPRFDSQGNSRGLLFYEPSERVYIKFNNPSEFLLNSLDIDIVDLSEKPLEDLSGNTLCALHIRKSRD